jgi:hypothetical protein
MPWISSESAGLQHMNTHPKFRHQENLNAWDAPYTPSSHNAGHAVPWVGSCGYCAAVWISMRFAISQKLHMCVTLLTLVMGLTGGLSESLGVLGKLPVFRHAHGVGCTCCGCNGAVSSMYQL